MSEFEKKLCDKYGPNWMFVKLTDDEYEQIEVPSGEEIREALKKGMENARKAYENKNCIAVDPRIRFR